METVRLEPIRNVAIVSSAGAGKTSLSEALLYVGGAIPILGSVTQGTTVSDFEPEELRHGNSTSTSLLQFRWNHTTINLIDPPGALDLLGEPLAALHGRRCGHPASERKHGGTDGAVTAVGTNQGVGPSLSGVRQWA